MKILIADDESLIRQKTVIFNSWLFMSGTWLYRDCASDFTHRAIFSCDSYLFCQFVSKTA